MCVYKAINFVGRKQRNETRTGHTYKKSDSAPFNFPVLHLKKEHTTLHFTMVSWSLMLGKTHFDVPQAHTHMHTVLWAILFLPQRSPPCKTSSSSALSQERGGGCVCVQKREVYTHLPVNGKTHTDTTTIHTRALLLLLLIIPHDFMSFYSIPHSFPFSFTSHAQQAA